jgi:hypothetical protein
MSSRINKNEIAQSNMTGGTPPNPQLVLQTGMNEFEKIWRRWRAVRTEKIEELLLAWMQPGLEHS